MSAPESIRRILVPLDGSRLAETVLPSAFAVAARTGAIVTLFHVIEHNPPESVHGEPHLETFSQAAAYLGSVAERWQHAGVPFEMHIHETKAHDVAESIAQHAVELQADLIAMATHGSGGIRGLLFGTIAQQALRRTSTPLLLLEPGEEEPRFVDGTILVPVGGSDGEHDPALPLAVLLARSLHARLHLVQVVPTVGTVGQGQRGAATFAPTATAAMLDLEGQQAARALEELRRQIDGGLTVTGEVRRGAVVEELEQAIAESGAGLVVMSTHARGTGLDGIFNGSVGARLVGRTEVPYVFLPLPRGSA